MGRTLVAEAVARALGPEEVPLFPTEAHPGVAFTQDELFAQSRAYSRLYKSLADALAPRLAAHHGISESAARVFARDSIPSVAHFFLDRALRLGRFAAHREAVSVAGAEFGACPARSEEFRSRAERSRDFNQALLARLAPLYGLPVGPTRPAPRPQTAPAAQPSFVNHNFLGRSTADKLRRRFYLALARAFPGRVPALSMSYATFLLQDAGLYGRRGFADLRGIVSFERPPLDPDQRRRVLAPALEEAEPAVSAFLKEAGADARLSAEFRRFALEFFPTDALEGARGHLDMAASVLSRFHAPLVFAEVRNIEATAFLAAAKQLGLGTVGLQEGGHYGYEDDYVAGYENCYPHFDRYITWGWRRFPEGESLGPIEAVPLPTPWLSERRKQWLRVLGEESARWGAEKPFDLLLMSNKIYPFPPAPSGGAVSRSDHTPAFAAMLRDLVAQARRAGARILHKSYDRGTMGMLARTMEELEGLGGDCYRHVDRLDKGLSAELLSRCRIVLWDQPGTGFLECLTSRIPAMIHWPRLYNREVPWAREIFAELEAVGLVHRTAEAVLAELARFKAAPAAWMEEPRRNEVIARFCREYAWVEDDWRRSWRDFLKRAA